MSETEREILQSVLPLACWLAPHTLRLPGTVPIALADWLVTDEVYAEQMALRDELIAGETDVVHAMPETCAPAARELLELLTRQLAGAPGYEVSTDSVRRPDGVVVPLDTPPLIAAGRLVQEDLLILENPQASAEPVLTGGVLCFPSSWSLRQKMGLGLTRIHLPVDKYDEHTARRVNRLFAGIRPETPLMRSNVLFYTSDHLFNPRYEFNKSKATAQTLRTIRVERQVLLRLAISRAIVFSIHTFLLRPASLTPRQRKGLENLRPDLFPPDAAS